LRGVVKMELSLWWNVHMCRGTWAVIHKVPMLAGCTAKLQFHHFAVDRRQHSFRLSIPQDLKNGFSEGAIATFR
jgi:hypothetical protein